MHILILTPHAEQGQMWRHALGLHGANLSIEVSAGALGDQVFGNLALRPDIVVLDASQPADLDALLRISPQAEGIDFVLRAPSLDSDTLLRLMRSGVREVLPLHADTDAVTEAVGRVVRQRHPASTRVRQGKMLAFISCKGGSGATFAAANLAHMLADNGRRSVALIDLNLQFGDALLFISSNTASSNVADVALNIERLDHELLRSAMLEVSPGLSVLPSPEDPAQAAEVSPAHAKAILELARSMFDYVVVDTGRALNSVTLQALDMADEIHPVLQLTLPFIRDGKRLQRVFESLGYPHSKIAWVVNRHEKGTQITLDDLKKTLSVRDLIILPNQYDVVANSVNQGEPVSKVAPKSAISQALRAMAHRIDPPAAPAQATGWFQSMLAPRRKPASEEAP